MAISFSCGNCGKLYEVDDRFAGKKATCRGCGTINAIPAEASEPAPQQAIPRISILPIPVINEPSPPPPPTPPHATMTSLQTAPVRVAHADEDMLPLVDAPEEEEPQIVPADPNEATHLGHIREEIDVKDEPLLEEEPPKRPLNVQRALPIESCPHCKTPLPKGGSICTACGFNLLTDQKIATAVVPSGPPKPDDDEEQVAPPGDRRPATPSLRITAMALIIGGLVISAIPLFGVSALAITAPLLGAAMAMIAAAIYLIDGAWEWSLVGLAAMMLSIVIMLTFGNASSSSRAPAVAQAPPVAATAPTPATTQSSPANLPKVYEVAPGSFEVRQPTATENPLEYWREVLLEKDTKVRLIAIDRLAQLPPKFREEAADAIAQIINDENIEVRRAAMKNLGLAKTPKTIAAAITALDDKDQEISRKALGLLADYKDDSSIDPIAKKYPVFGEAVLIALAGFDPPSHDKVQAAYKSILDGADAAARPQIINSLVRCDPDAAVVILMANLDDSDAQIRQPAMLRLAEMKYEPAIEPILQKLKEDPQTAGKALIKFGPIAVKPVAAMLTQTDAALRLSALNILKEIGDAQALQTIKSAAKDTDFAFAMAARDAWRKLEPGAFPPIDEAILDLDRDKEFLNRALQSLKSLPVDEHQKKVSAKLFELVMGDGDDVVKSAACEALEIWADAATKDLVIAAFKPDSEDSKRSYAIKLAVHFKDRRAVRPLCQCLALGKNIPDVLAALREFDNAPEEFLIPLIAKGDPMMQGYCFDVLRDIGTRRCFPALNAVATSKTGDELLKKRAKETMIEITRRLNTAAARKTTTTRPATLPHEIPVEK